MSTKLGKDLIPGDRLIVDNEARIVTIKEVHPGMIRGTKMIVWGNEWSTVPIDAIVELAN